MQSLFGVPLYLLHPMMVHFPIALLIVGFGAALLARWKRSPDWLPKAAAWMLWTGTLLLWLVLALGLLAENKAQHVPPAWKDLYEHKWWAWRAAWAFTGLSLWRWLAGRRLEWATLLAWLGCVALLAVAAHHGAELVYTWGMGVAP